MVLANEGVLADHLSCGHIIIDYCTEELLISKSVFSMRSGAADELYSDDAHAWIVPLYTRKKAGGTASAVDMLFALDECAMVNTTTLRIFGCHLYALPTLCDIDKFSNYNPAAVGERDRLFYRGERRSVAGWPTGDSPSDCVRVSGVTQTGFVPRERYIDFVTSLRARYTNDSIFDAFAIGADALIQGAPVPGPGDSEVNAGVLCASVMVDRQLTFPTGPSEVASPAAAYTEQDEPFVPSESVPEPMAPRSLDLTPGALVYMVGQPDIIFTVGPKDKLYRLVTDNGNNPAGLVLSSMMIPDNRMFRNVLSDTGAIDKSSTFLTELAALEERLTTEVDAVRRDTQIALARLQATSAVPLSGHCIEI